MLKLLEVDGVGPVKDLAADFGKRINVLTGDNSLDKSFLLDSCFWTFTGTWPNGRVALPERNGPKTTPSITASVFGKTGRPQNKTFGFDFHTQR
jgi:hypothetical protein